MRYVLCISFLLLGTTILYGSTFSDRIHGLKDEKGEMHFEVSGYSISVYGVKGSVNDEGTLRLVEKAYRLDRILMTYTDSTLSMDNKIIEGLIDTPDLPLQISQKCYLLQKGDETMAVLYLETSLKRDFVLEEEIVHAYIDGQLSKYASSFRTTRSLWLAGEKNDLDFAAEWLAPHRLVYEESQINWSEFSSFSRANQYIKNQMLIDKVGLEIVEDIEEDVLFDEEPASARKIVYYDRSGNNDRRYLFVYYLVAKLRGRYVSCVLSHYEFLKYETDLPVLLKSLLEVPALNRQISASKRTEKKQGYEEEKNSRFLFEFQAGGELPLGNLRNVYDVAGLLGLNLGYSVSRKMGVDFGVQFAFPANSSRFNLYDGSMIDETEVSWFARLNARCRFKMKQTKKISTFGYFGTGIVWLTTDLDGDIYDWETDSYNYYSISSLDLFGGFNIRYKFIGLFAEYHFTPYGMSDELKDTFGHSSFNIGISFSGFRW